MKGSVFVAAALLAATTTLTAANAASVPPTPKTLRTAGYWSAWYFDSNSDGEPMPTSSDAATSGSGPIADVLGRHSRCLLLTIPDIGVA